MKRTCILACVMVLSLPAMAKAHDFDIIKLTCPICSTRFEVASMGTYSTSGGSAEGRPRSYFNVVESTVFYCPHCHYAGQLSAFKIKDNKYYTLKLPNAKQAKAIRAMLAKRQDLTPGKLLYPVERFELVEKCLRLQGAKPNAMLDASLMCAWICDDAGEDALALKYRKQAVAACGETLKDKTLTATQRIWRRKLYWVLTSNIGKSNEALRGLTDLLADSKRTVQAAKKQLPPKPKGYDEAHGDMPYELQDHDKDEENGLFDPGDGAPDPDPPMDPKTKAKLQKIWRSWLDFDKFTWAVEAVEDEIIWIRYKTLDLAAAIKVARNGGYLKRYAFIDVHKSIEDPKVIAAIKAFIVKPLDKRPKSDGPEEFKDRQTKCRERFLNMIMEGDDTSARLRKYAFNKGKSEGYDRFVDPYDGFPGQADDVVDELKDVSTADLTARLVKAWRNVDRKGHPSYWKIPRDVLGQLARRSDKDAVAVLIADFEQHLDWYTKVLKDLVGSWSSECNDDLRYHYLWGSPGKTTEYLWPLYKIIARDSKLTTAMARRLIEKIQGGKIEGETAVAGIMPLGFLKTKESRQLLIQATGLKNSSAAFTAAKCLLLRNDPAGKSAMINVILTHRRWDLPADKTGDTFTRMLDSKDAAVMPRFQKAYLKDPELTDTSDTNYEEGKVCPIRLMATLAKLDQEQLSIYEAFIAELGKPKKRPVSGEWSNATGGYYTTGLIEASEIYYRPCIGKQLAAAMEHLSDSDTTPELIETLMKLSADNCTRALAKQLRRPTTLSVKAAIIKASAKLDIPGLPKKLTEWSVSRNIPLARLAKKAIARLKKAR